MTINAANLRGGNITLTDGGLAEGTNAGTIKTAATVTSMIDGIFCSDASGTDNITVQDEDGDGLALQAVATKCLYTVGINAAGSYIVKKGAEVLTALVTAGVALMWPDLPPGYAPVGGFKVETNGSTTFTGGTTDLGAAGITDTYYDFGIVPAGVVTS